MSPLAEIAKELTPGSVGVWTGVLMFAGWWLREWRETRKLSSADRQARREGYARQVSELSAENRKLRQDLIDSNSRHDDYRRICQQENDQLREQVIGLQDHIAGLMRKMADVAARMARGEVGPEVSAALLQLAAEVSPPASDRDRAPN